MSGIDTALKMLVAFAPAAAMMVIVLVFLCFGYVIKLLQKLGD